MATALEGINFCFGHVRNQGLYSRIAAEKMLDVVSTVFCAQGLILAIGGVGEGVEQHMASVACKECIPV